MGASGPFIIDAGGERRRGLLLAGGQLFSTLCTLHFAPWTAWQGSRRPTSDVKTARQTLSIVTLVTHASSITLVGAMECRSIRALVQGIDIMAVVVVLVVMGRQA